MVPGRQYRPEDILDALRRRRWLVVTPLWIALVGSVLYTRSLPNRFQSDVRIQLVPAGVSDRFLPPTVTSTLAARLPALTEMVLNGDRLQRVVDELNLYRPDVEPAVGDPVARIRRDFQVRVANADTFVLTYVASDARTAMAGAELLGASFIDQNRRRSEVVAGATNSFLDAQLADTRARLETNEQQLADFNTTHAGELPSQLQSNLQMLQNAQLQLQTVRDSLGRDRDESMALDRLIEEADANSANASGGDRVEAVRSGADSALVEGSVAQLLQAASRELREMQSRLKPEHPDVVRLKRRVAELEAQVRAEPPRTVPTPGPAVARNSPARENRITDLRAAREKLGRQIDARQVEEARLRDQIDSYRSRIDATPGRETELTAMMRDYDTLKELYSKLLAKKEEARLAADLQDNEIGEQFVIVSPAVLPTRPVSPNRLQLNIVGTMFGLMLGVAMAAFIEYRDTSVRSAQDVAVALGLPLLATIPVIQSLSERRWARPRQAVGWFATTLAAVATALLLWTLSQ